MTLSGQGISCVAGETFDSIALAVYGDEKYAADLLCANPEYCHKYVFTGGELLLLPVVEIPETTDNDADYVPGIAPWKESEVE